MGPTRSRLSSPRTTAVLASPDVWKASARNEIRSTSFPVAIVSDSQERPPVAPALHDRDGGLVEPCRRGSDRLVGQLPDEAATRGRLDDDERTRALGIGWPGDRGKAAAVRRRRGPEDDRPAAAWHRPSGGRGVAIRSRRGAPPGHPAPRRPGRRARSATSVPSSIGVTAIVDGIREGQPDDLGGRPHEAQSRGRRRSARAGAAPTRPARRPTTVDDGLETGVIAGALGAGAAHRRGDDHRNRDCRQGRGGGASGCVPPGRRSGGTPERASAAWRSPQDVAPEERARACVQEDLHRPEPFGRAFPGSGPRRPRRGEAWGREHPARWGQRRRSGLPRRMRPT